MMGEFDIRTCCSDSLLMPGQCCVCHQRATVAAAVLTADLVEHARCEGHGSDTRFLAAKPLIWDPIWGGAGDGAGGEL